MRIPADQRCRSAGTASAARSLTSVGDHPWDATVSNRVSPRMLPLQLQCRHILGTRGCTSTPSPKSARPERMGWARSYKQELFAQSPQLPASLAILQQGDQLYKMQGVQSPDGREEQTKFSVHRHVFHGGQPQALEVPASKVSAQSLKII
jgi:hypothetical protein